MMATIESSAYAQKRPLNENYSDEKVISMQTTPPQIYLDLMLRDRGYSTRTYCTLDTGYYAKPTLLQQASFSVHLLRLVRIKDNSSLKGIMESGLSPNPCNKYGESLIQVICSRGDADLLELQMDIGGSVQVSDKCGRTPLHDICRRHEPCFKMAEMVVSKDLNLFHMKDVYGAVPLSYVPKEHWSQWNEFLCYNMDRWWPKGNASSSDEYTTPKLVEAAPNSNPIPDPKNALTVELASMVASGTMEPEEALLFSYDFSKIKARMKNPFNEKDLDMAMAHFKNELRAKSSLINISGYSNYSYIERL